MKQLFASGSLLTFGARLLTIILIAFFCILCMPLTLHVAEKPAVAHSGIRIMPLGDSITFGTGSTANGGYRVVLWKDCTAAQWQFSFVGSQMSGPSSLPDGSNEGHPGWRIDEVSKHIVGWLKQYRPQIILLHIGTNDIIQNHQLATIVNRLQYLLEQIVTTEPNARVVVAQIIPLNKRGLDSTVQRYNEAIPIIVQKMAERGNHITYVDMHSAVSITDLSDGIHPNDVGYAHMAQVWYTALRSLIRGEEFI